MSFSLKAIMPRSFFGRAMLILLMPMVLAQIVATYIFFDRHWENLSGRLSYGVASDISLIIGSIERYGDTPAKLNDFLAQIERHTDMRIKRGPLEPLPEQSPLSRNNIIGNALLHSLSLRFNEGRFVAIDRSAVRLWEVDVTTDHELVRITIPERRLHSPTASIFLLWMTGSACFFFAISLAFMRNQIRPIRRLAEAAEGFGKGHEVVGFKPEGALELRRAAHAFIMMRERIKRQIRQRTEMLAGVSHDLRTPLTRMKLQLALMSKQKGMDELRTDVEEMERMVEGYLAFARGETGEASIDTDLAELLQSLVSDAKRSHDNREIGLVAPPCHIRSRPQALRRCLGNLVNNALAYAQNVSLICEVNDNSILIHVDDDGPGIPAEKRSDVLRPFVRLDDSRNPDTGGVGLGLSIARDVARGHGGDLMLSDSPLGGLRATVRLPR